MLLLRLLLPLLLLPLLPLYRYCYCYYCHYNYYRYYCYRYSLPNQEGWVGVARLMLQSIEGHAGRFGPKLPSGKKL